MHITYFFVHLILFLLACFFSPTINTAHIYLKNSISRNQNGVMKNLDHPIYSKCNALHFLTEVLLMQKGRASGILSKNSIFNGFWILRRVLLRLTIQKLWNVWKKSIPSNCWEIRSSSSSVKDFLPTTNSNQDHRHLLAK